MTSGLALVAREQRLRLFTIRGHIHDALKTKGAVTDPHATKLCAVLALVEQAIEILQENEVTLPKFDTEAVIERRLRVPAGMKVWSPVRTIWVAMQGGEGSPVTCLVRSGTPVITGDRLRIGPVLCPVASVEPDGPLFSRITFSQPGDSPQQTGASAPAGGSNE